jgi:hypothetical protein
MGPMQCVSLSIYESPWLIIERRRSPSYYSAVIDLGDHLFRIGGFIL